jgi:hypothetical protein
LLPYKKRLLRPASTQERQVKMQKPVLSGGLRGLPQKKTVGAKNNISIYIVIFIVYRYLKIIAIKGTIRKI